MENLGDEEQGKQGYRFHFATVNSQTVVAQRRERLFMVCVRKDIDLGEFDFPQFEGEPIALRTVLDSLTAKELATYTISDKLWGGGIKGEQPIIWRGTRVLLLMLPTSINRPILLWLGTARTGRNA